MVVPIIRLPSLFHQQLRNPTDCQNKFYCNNFFKSSKLN